MTASRIWGLTNCAAVLTAVLLAMLLATLPRHHRRSHPRMKCTTPVTVTPIGALTC